MTSAGVRNPSDFLARLLSSSATWVQAPLRIFRQVRSLVEMLPQQTVGIPVRGALPGAMRVCEIHPDPDPFFQILMSRHLLALVVGQGLPESLWQRVWPPCEAFQNRFCHGVIDSCQDHETTVPVDQRTNGAAVIGPLDEISFPVARHLPTLGLCRSFAAGTHVSYATAAILAPTARTTLLVPLAQCLDERRLQFSCRMGIDVLVDRFVTDLLGLVPGVVRAAELKGHWPA